MKNYKLERLENGETLKKKRVFYESIDKIWTRT
jgi:hypothetical protein